MRLLWRQHGRGFIADDGGFTTVGMVLALLITISLLFTTAQVYRVQTASASVQNVADSVALAAEGPVAEFYVVVRVCDAISLSLALTGVVVTGVGIVALCIPPTAALGSKLIEVGKSVFSARDSFVEQANAALEKVQRALPYLSAAEALSVARANSGGVGKADYVAFAVLLPESGETAEIPGAGNADGAIDAVTAEEDNLAGAAQQAEQAAQEAQAQKEAAFMSDCGRNPGYCMYERARSLAGMDGASNPLYESVDAWSFSVALSRAQAYYAVRASQQGIEGATVEDRADSVLRGRFYAFAQRELAGGYVRETESSFDAYFPSLPRNTAQMRETPLFTEVAYPVTDIDGVRTMHAWQGCPNAADAAGMGAIIDLESGGYATCELCRFSASSMGKVAAASTSIENGFEHHYAKVVQAAEAYEKARDAGDPLKQQVQETAGSLLEGFSGVLSDASKRVEAKPPGRVGAIALVANTARTPADAGFVSSFVSSGRPLGARAAVSAATLVSDSPEEGRNVLTSLLDGYASRVGGAATQAGSLALSFWSAALGAYANGYEAIRNALKSVLDGLPLASASGLGTWAADALESFMEGIGLQPAKLDAPKPALVNTARVAAAGGGSFAENFAEVQRGAVSASESVSGGAFSVAVSGVENRVIEGLGGWNGTIEVARIELLGPDGPSIPVEITVPQRIVSIGNDVVARAVDALRGLVGSVTGVRQWE